KCVDGNGAIREAFGHARKLDACHVVLVSRKVALLVEACPSRQRVSPRHSGAAARFVIGSSPCARRMWCRTTGICRSPPAARGGNKRGNQTRRGRTNT